MFVTGIPATAMETADGGLAVLVPLGLSEC